MSLEPDQHLADQLIHRAIDQAINFFDTADLYQKGANETMLGKSLKGKRNQVLLASKGGNQWLPDGSAWTWNASPDYLISAVEQSLRRLGTDRLDLYQLHGGTIDDPIDDVVSTFELLKKQGKILYYGISSIRPNVIREYLLRSHISSVMMQYSLLDRRPEEECFQQLQEAQVGVLARGSLAKGLLAGKTPTSFLNYSIGDVETAAAAIRKLAGPDRSMAQTAIGFALRNQVVSSAIIGMRTLPQLEDALGYIKSNKLAPEEIARLNTILLPNTYDQHR